MNLNALTPASTGSVTTSASTIVPAKTVPTIRYTPTGMPLTLTSPASPFACLQRLSETLCSILSSSLKAVLSSVVTTQDDLDSINIEKMASGARKMFDSMGIPEHVHGDLIHNYYISIAKVSFSFYSSAQTHKFIRQGLKHQALKYLEKNKNSPESLDSVSEDCLHDPYADQGSNAITFFLKDIISEVSYDLRQYVTAILSRPVFFENGRLNRQQTAAGLGSKDMIARKMPKAESALRDYLQRNFYKDD